LDACVKREGKRSLKATNCKAGFVVFGPYTAVTEGSEVEVSFEVQATTAVTIATDMVSEMGTQFHAGINEQQIDAGTTRRLGYRVRMPKKASAFESRVFVKLDGGQQSASFQINDFALILRPAG
jgi:hypothetical protein